MRKLKLISRNKEDNEEGLENNEVESRWSIKKIAIAGMLALFLSALAYGSLSDLGTQKQKEEILGEVTEEQVERKPEISIPSGDEVKEIISDAKERLSEIDPEDTISSQPQIQRIITDLEKITKTETSVKETVCKVVCGGN